MQREGSPLLRRHLLAVPAPRLLDGLGRFVPHDGRREQLHHLAVPEEVPRARLALRGPGRDAVVPPLRHRLVGARDRDGGLQGDCAPRPVRQVPACRRGRLPAGVDDHPLDAYLQRGRGGPPGKDLREGARRRGHPVPRQGAASTAARRDRNPGGYAGRRTCRPALQRAVRRAGRAARSGASRYRVGRRERDRGHGHRARCPGRGQGGLRARQGVRAGHHRAARRVRRLRRGVRLAHGHERLRRQQAHLRQPSRKGRVLPAGAVLAPLPRLLEVRLRAGVPARGRVVHLHGRPAPPDSGRHPEHSLDPVVRSRARAGLAAQHGRLDDLQEALLGPGAAHFQVRVRPLRRDRQRRGDGAEGCRGMGRVQRPLSAPSVDRRREDRVPAMRRSRVPHHRRGQSLAGRRHRLVLHAGLPAGQGVLERLVPRRLDLGELPGPVPKLVLLPAHHEHRARELRALQDGVQLRADERRERRGDAQEQGQRHLVRGRRGAHGCGLYALAVLASQSGAERQFRLPLRGRGAPPLPHSVVERLLLLRNLRQHRRVRPLYAAAGRGHAPGTRQVDHLRAEHAGARNDQRPREFRARSREPRSRALRRVPVELVRPPEPPPVLEV